MSNSSTPATPRLTNLIGYLGSFLTCITFVPQVIKSWETQSVGDLSLTMVCIVITSTLVWLWYGIRIKSGPVIVANSIVFLLGCILLYFKLTFRA
ncbi:MAG TPA: SemiSWEET family transporter [Chitinophagaceae bacterium]